MTDSIKQPFYKKMMTVLSLKLSKLFKKNHKKLTEEEIIEFVNDISLRTHDSMNNIGLSLKSILKKYRETMTQFEQVREFHQAFNCPAPEVPTELSDKLSMNRASFIMEEVIELLYATSGDKERFDRFFAELILNAEKTYDKQLKKPFPDNKLIGQIDAFTDILYFANGGFVETGIIPDNIFRLVHKANMGKIFPDGKPHYNEVGKVVKPDNWENDHAPEPKIQIEVDNQIEFGEKRFE